MAFLDTNAVTRGNETVDTKFSPLLEPNLWAENIFEAGRTFTDKYETDAMGQLFVRKLGKGTVDRSASLTFTHNQTSDDLISIVLDEPFKQSEAIYESVEIARTSGKGMQKMETVVKNVAEEWQQVAHDKLVAQATPSTVNTVVTASADVKDVFTAVRKEIRDNKARPNVMLASTNFYAKMLTYSGKEFQPATNDEILRTGQVGRFLGVDVYESEQLEDTGAAGSTEFVLYDYEAYSILTQLIATRMIDAGKDWTGSAAQVELKSGFKVTTPERVYKKVISA